MVTFKITDRPDKDSKRESFLANTACVVSHSGLHRTESSLIEQIPSVGNPPSQVLVTGSRTGTLAMVLARHWPSVRVTCHALDIHHAKTIERNLASNNVKGITVVCSPMLPQGPYDVAFFSGTDTSTPAELILDQMEDLHEQLLPGGVCWIAYEGDTRSLQKQIHQIFGHLMTEVDQRGFICGSARKTRPLEKRRSFLADFKASLPGLEAIPLVSLPGVFCHRRPDMGGLALAEVAAKETSCHLNPAPRILDMGCGCGLVGILLAKAYPAATVTFVDSYSRAIEATRQNIESIGMRNHELVLSDTGIDHGDFDLLVGNPPYYSDYRIAGLFVETAFQVLKPGGVGMLVAKSAAGLDACIKTRFDNTTVIPRRGYSVIRFARQTAHPGGHAKSGWRKDTPVRYRSGHGIAKPDSGEDGIVDNRKVVGNAKVHRA